MTARMATLLIVLLGFCTFVRAGIIVPQGLAPGSQYYLAFVTHDTITAVSTNKSDYDSFAQSEAEMSPKTSGVPQWHAIVNIASSTTLNLSASVPVYLVDGTTLIASKASNLFNTSLSNPILNPINQDQFGNIYTDAVWTGSDPFYPWLNNQETTGVTLSGETIWNLPGAVSMGHTASVVYYHYGFGHANYTFTELYSPTLGSAARTDDGWLASYYFHDDPNFTAEAPIYAISNVLTVPLPEPSGRVTGIIACVLMFTFYMRRRRSVIRVPH